MGVHTIHAALLQRQVRVVVVVVAGLVAFSPLACLISTRRSSCAAIPEACT